MANIISNVGQLVNALFVSGENSTAWVPAVIDTITGTPILLIGVITGLSGLALGMVRRLMNIR